MIERCDYTKEMWAKKSKIDLAFNALFLKQDFRSYVTSQVGYCPRDLNFDTIFEDNGDISLLCCMKHYGHDSSSNKGQSFTDLGDYETEMIKEDKGELYFPLLCAYIRENSTKLANKLNELNCKIYW